MNTVATTPQVGDRIILTMAVEKPDGGRISMFNTFDHTGQQIDGKGNAIGGRSLTFGGGADLPSFPTDEYVALLQENKKAEADALSVEYYEQYKAAAADGASSPLEGLAASLYAFAKAEYGVSEKDQEGPVLKPTDVIVMAPIRHGSEAVVFTAQLAPKWG